jgi:hypothetical protein
MEMAMYIDSKPAQAFWMDWDVSQYHTIQHMTSPNGSKILSIFIIGENIVVSTDQHLVSIQPGQSGKCPAINYNVPQVINFVSWTNTIVPPTNHFFVHFRRIRPWSQFGHTIGLGEVTNSCMSKMCITD